MNYFYLTLGITIGICVTLTFKEISKLVVRRKEVEKLKSEIEFNNKFHISELSSTKKELAKVKELADRRNWEWTQFHGLHKRVCQLEYDFPREIAKIKGALDDKERGQSQEVKA